MSGEIYIYTALQVRIQIFQWRAACVSVCVRCAPLLMQSAPLGFSGAHVCSRAHLATCTRRTRSVLRKAQVHLRGGPCRKSDHTTCASGSTSTATGHSANLSQRRFGAERHLHSAQISHCLVHEPMRTGKQVARSTPSERKGQKGARAKAVRVTREQEQGTGRQRLRGRASFFKLFWQSGIAQWAQAPRPSASSERPSQLLGC
jgi:hypothetical protein